MRKNKAAGASNGFDEWGGYMDAKKSKLEEQFAQDAMRNPYKESDLFAGISIFVNGLTNPSADELKRIMMRNGGVYHTYQRSSTNFVIATNLPDVKVRQITSAKIISPQWVVDCLKENKILDYAKYLLYTNCKTSQPKIAFGPCKPNETVSLTKCDATDADCKNILDNLNFLNTAIRQDASELADKSTTAVNDLSSGHDESKRARTAVDPNFLTEFYSNSRLHHIATLGAGFKHYVSKLRESHEGGFPARDQLTRRQPEAQPDAQLISLVIQTKTNSQIIMHIDMDCFFVSVGLRSRPQLRGLPVAVTHSKGAAGNKLQSANGVDRKKEMELYVKRHDDRYKTEHSMHLDDEENGGEMPAIDNSTSLSEIASCSYEARKMGLKNGMFVGAALKLCPDLKTIPYDFEAYKEVAHTLYDTITQYTLDVEAVSCDEMYVNLTQVLKETNISVDEFVTHVRNEITNKTKCPCSAGVGANKLQARMATKKAKPNGQFHLTPEMVEEYFSEILISDLPGVGYSTTLKLKNSNLKTCSDLRQLPLARLQQEFGKKLGETLHQYCRGIDIKPLVYDQIRKSVSAEVNYGIRFTETAELDTFLKQLCAEVHSRLTEIGAKGRTITLKYMVRAADAPVETAKFMGHGFCDNVTKSTTLPSSTNELAVITQTVFSIKNALNVPADELRGIGIQISKLDTTSKANKDAKSNTLRNMFQKVVEKNRSNATDLATNNRASREDIRIENRISSLRKTKSFELPTTSRRIGDLFAVMPSKPKLENCFENLDLDVLAQLPAEIREEVLRDKNLLLKNTNNDIGTPKLHRKPTARKIEDDFHLKTDAEQKFVASTSASMQLSISAGNILDQPNWRIIMTEWLESTSEPIECDTEIITGYFREFMAVRRLNEVHLCLKFLHRKISETYLANCRWHRVYYTIVNAVQHHMAVIYGENCSLHIENDFNCRKCVNKDSILC